MSVGTPREPLAPTAKPASATPGESVGRIEETKEIDIQLLEFEFRDVEFHGNVLVHNGAPDDFVLGLLVVGVFSKFVNFYAGTKFKDIFASDR